MQQTPHRVESIVLAAVTLHNLMRIRYPDIQINLLDKEDRDHRVVPGAWREAVDLTCLQRLQGNNSTLAAKAQREFLCKYYNSTAGSVPWQDDMI